MKNLVTKVFEKWFCVFLCGNHTEINKKKVIIHSTQPFIILVPNWFSCLHEWLKLDIVRNDWNQLFFTVLETTWVTEIFEKWCCVFSCENLTKFKKKCYGRFHSTFFCAGIEKLNLIKSIFVFSAMEVGTCFYAASAT